MKAIRISLLPLLMPALAASAAPLQSGWKLCRGATLETRDGKQYLQVAVAPADRDAMNCAEAKIDLTPFRGTALSFRIRARAGEVSTPPHDYNGVKFMLNYVDGEGAEFWYNVTGVAGSFDWRELAFSATVNAAAETGRIRLGLQESSGEVEFDLSSLKIEPLFAPVRSDYKARYTDRVMRVPQLRGVMSPIRKFTEDDWKTLSEWNVNLVRAQLCRKGELELNAKAHMRSIQKKPEHIKALFQKDSVRYAA